MALRFNEMEDWSASMEKSVNTRKTRWHFPLMSLPQVGLAGSARNRKEMENAYQKPRLGYESIY